jgi:hypothetical protein
MKPDRPLEVKPEDLKGMERTVPSQDSPGMFLGR